MSWFLKKGKKENEETGEKKGPWFMRREKATEETKEKGGVGGNTSEDVKKFSDKKSGKAFPWSKK